jgi:ADP-L-glycero-D-manno-heptose 6-epimerase
MPVTDTIIITGGAGLIGSNLAAALNARGYRDLVIVDHLNHPAKEANLNKLTYTDFLDKQEFRRRFNAGRQPRAAAVFHLGACSSTTETDAAYLDDNNLAYTRELCEWALRQEARFIYASSAATYGDGSRGYRDDEGDIPNLQPLNLYGLSKQKFDLWALEHRLLGQIAGIKYFNVFGPGEDHKGDMRSVVNKAFRQIEGTGRLELFRSHRPDYKDGMQERDFVYVKDAVAITLFFLDHPGVSGIFNAGTGRTHTWVDLANAVFAALGREPRIDFIDMPETLRDKYQYYTLADIRKLRTAGYNAAFQPLAESVADYAQNRLD